MTIIITAIVWLAGIFFADEFQWPPLIYMLGFVLIAIPAFIFRARTRVRAPLFYSLIFILGGVFHTITLTHIQRSYIDEFIDTGPLLLEGWIDDFPTTRDHRTNLSVSIYQVNGEKIDDRILVTVYGDNDFAYGDVIEVYGELTEAPVYSDFSYRDYLARKGIHAIVYYGSVDVIGHHTSGSIKGLLFQARAAAESKLLQLFPEPYASLITGILLGIESGISDSVRDDFLSTGTSHTIAISGSNMVIIAAILTGFLKHIMGERSAALITLPVLFIYAIFTGGDPAVMRASVMMAMALFAPLIHRQAYAPASLAVAAIVLTMIDSNILWDMGFQLSFLATLGLILFARPLSEMVQKKTKKDSDTMTGRSGFLTGLIEMILVTLSAQVMTLPYLLIKTGELSVVSFPVNILIAPLQGPIMLFGICSILGAFIIYPLGQVFAWITLIFMVVSKGIISFSASLPFASLQLLPLSPGWGITVYVMIALGAFFMSSSEKNRKHRIEKLRINLPTKLVFATMAMLLGLIIMGVSESPDGRLHIHFTNSEQGPSLIITPSGRSVLLFPEGSVREILVMIGEGLPFWDRSIDVVIIQGDGGYSAENLEDISRRYSFETLIYIPEISRQEPPSEIYEQADQIFVVEAGTEIVFDDGVSIRFIASTVTQTPVSPMISIKDATILLLGPLPVSELEELVVCDATFIELPEMSYLTSYSPDDDVCNAQFYLVPEHIETAIDQFQPGEMIITRSAHFSIDSDGSSIRIHY